MNERVPEYVPLYRRAFDAFGAIALWNRRRLDEPTPADALAVARALRREGNLSARRLAEQIEETCLAAGAFNRRTLKSSHEPTGKTTIR